ncbi:MAG: hypothetical protein F4Z01_03960 [Gammaproteobacteria bacterium]|nr:hypothetical protein [Gammaproteobacteria bacterium]
MNRRDAGNTEYIWQVFNEASMLALGNENLIDAFQDQYWLHVVSASGEHRKALNLIFRELSNDLTANYEEGLFSIYATAQTARMTGLNVPAAVNFSRNRSADIFDRGQLARSEGHYANRFSVRDAMERTALPELTYQPDSHKQDFEVVYLKSRLISRAISDYHRYQGGAWDQVERWLLALRRDYFCQEVTYAGAMKLAREHDLDFDLFLREWLSENTLAGYEVSSSTTKRIANSENGVRQFLFSFEIANTQPTPGFVLIPAARSFSGFILPEHTAKRVTILLKRDSNASLDHTYDISAYTGLSLNRGPIEFLPLQNVDIDESLEAVEVLEPSDFVPTQNGIIVDDLDAGFIAHQRKPVRNRFRYAPQDWFALPILHEEFDGVLPNVGSSAFKIPRSSWLRFNRGNAYGKYRRTVAITSMTNSRKTDPIRFVADIPEAGQWSLDYYLYHGLNSDLFSSISDFKLQIENGSSSWSEEFYPDPFASGWKLVGEFELESGKTDVVVVGATEPSVVYADAIRWRKVSEQK